MRTGDRGGAKTVRRRREVRGKGARRDTCSLASSIMAATVCCCLLRTAGAVLLVEAVVAAPPRSATPGRRKYRCTSLQFCCILWVARTRGRQLTSTDAAVLRVSNLRILARALPKPVFYTPQRRIGGGLWGTCASRAQQNAEKA